MISVMNYFIILKEYLCHIVWRFIPPLKKRLRFDEWDNGKILSFLGEYNNDYAIEVTKRDEENIIKQADNALKHSFTILGVEKTVSDIDWSTDIKTNYKWEVGRFYTDYSNVDNNTPVDVKIPWEISRCHHFLWLAQAYRITNNKVYSEEILNQITDWINHNPLMRSINWTCSMEVSIRAVNWMYALQIIANEIPENIGETILDSLYKHGFFIFNNLEKDGIYNANHYMADIVGLIYIGKCFKHTKDGEKWYNYAIKEFYHEIRTQFLPSGFHYERSISYHRLMLEMVSYTIQMLKHNEETVPNDILTRVNQMYNIVSFYIKFDGNVPGIADEDNGRFLPFIQRNYRDHSYLIEIANKKFGGLKKEPSLRVLTDVGMAVMKREGIYLFVNNAGLSRYADRYWRYLTHTHCDLLSFELSSVLGNIIVDPGTYTYTSSSVKRNEYRSTRKHNTIIVDNIEQYEFDNINLFKMVNTSFPEQLIGKEAEGETLIEGAYVRKRKEGDLYHKRGFNYGDHNLRISDLISSKGKHIAELRYHLAPDCLVTSNEKYFIITNHKQTIAILSVQVINENAEIIKWRVEDDTVSPSYGVELPSKTISLLVCFENECKINTIIKIEQ